MFSTRLHSFKFKQETSLLFQYLPNLSEVWCIGSQIRHNCALRTLEKQGQPHRPDDWDIFLIVKNKMRKKEAATLLKKVRKAAKPMRIKGADLFLVMTIGELTEALSVVTSDGRAKKLTLSQHQTKNMMNWRIKSPGTATFIYSPKYCQLANYGLQVLIQSRRRLHGKRVDL